MRRATMNKGVIGIGAITLLLSSPAIADVVHLAVGPRLARASLLSPSTHRYLRYLVKADGSRKLVDIWTRQLTFEPGPDGKRAMHIRQRWDRADGSILLVQDSWFEPGSFRPLTHVRRTVQGAKTSIWGFRFEPRDIKGMPELAGNDRAGFDMPQAEGHYNFEYDMELLQALPLKAGRSFDIPFYDAGIDKQPDRYDFTVAGSERVKGPDGKDIDCWLLTADYRTGKVVSRFWFAKANQVLIREVGTLPDGTTLIKTLLPPEPGDETQSRAAREPDGA